jgi:hypothetical protein
VRECVGEHAAQWKKKEVEFNCGGANHGRPAHIHKTSSQLGAVIICGRIWMKTSHSVSGLFAVHLVSNDKALVNSVGQVRMERKDETSVI